jgi:hypothetical protein
VNACPVFQNLFTVDDVVRVIVGGGLVVAHLVDLLL